MAELGYVGLGVMGGGVARRLLEAGHTVTGWNRTKEKAQPLLDAGLRWADTPREVAERSEIVFTMVTNTAAVQAVTEGPRRDPGRAGAGQGLHRHVDREPGEHPRDGRAGRRSRAP